MASEVEQLADLRGFLKLASQSAWNKGGRVTLLLLSRNRRFLGHAISI